RFSLGKVGLFECRSHNLRVNRVAPRRDGRLLDHIFEFAHISWPGMILQNAQRIGADSRLRARLATLHVQEMLYERADVFSALPQRRQSNAGIIQPIIEVLAKSSFSNCPL